MALNDDNLPLCLRSSESAIQRCVSPKMAEHSHPAKVVWLTRSIQDENRSEFINDETKSLHSSLAVGQGVGLQAYQRIFWRSARTGSRYACYEWQTTPVTVRSYEMRTGSSMARAHEIAICVNQTTFPFESDRKYHWRSGAAKTPGLSDLGL